MISVNQWSDYDQVLDFVGMAFAVAADDSIYLVQSGAQIKPRVQDEGDIAVTSNTTEQAVVLIATANSVVAL